MYKAILRDPNWRRVCRSFIRTGPGADRFLEDGHDGEDERPGGDEPVGNRPPLTHKPGLLLCSTHHRMARWKHSALAAH